ncbi:hypothetical protein, partial [Salmonella sp. s54412]|uniref:hypothetical protein n=1 Tax=Salmonella sp. s54412 TaxID=3160128 RepID=UPI003755239F
RIDPPWQNKKMRVLLVAGLLIILTITWVSCHEEDKYGEILTAAEDNSGKKVKGDSPAVFVGRKLYRKCGVPGMATWCQTRK